MIFIPLQDVNFTTKQVKENEKYFIFHEMSIESLLGSVCSNLFLQFRNYFKIKVKNKILKV